MNTRAEQPIATMRNVTKTYKTLRQARTTLEAIAGIFRRETITKHAVTDLDLDIQAGEIVGLLGPNGAGKTTIIKLLCGLLVPTSGTIRAFGEVPARRNYNFLKGISVIFGQKSMLWWDVSTRESLKIHKEVYAMSKSQFDHATDRLIETLGIGCVVDIPARNLSLGERMKCELALALLHSPRLLFADEPTIGLDVNAKVEVRNLLRLVNVEFGTTVVLTTHDMNDVEALVERVVLVSAGRKKFDGPLAELRAANTKRQPLIITYRNAPLIPVDLTARVTFRTPETIVMTVDDAALGTTIREATQWGTVADIKIEEPSLDHVMIEAFRRQRDEAS